ncbi:MAG: hypothetical protein Q7T76_16270 [Ferruginibacter sp.]|nr:hypothetical protein [Ferruginibacter sp.]
MAYLLWGLLNIGIFLFFISICFKATKLIRERMGAFASVVFVLGLLSFMGHSNNENDNNEPNSNHIKTWKFTSLDSVDQNSTHILQVDLEKTLVCKYDLGIKYGKDKQGEINIPISAYSSTNGFISGTNWKPISILVNRTRDNNKFEYFVDGLVEWKLLGATIYSQLKVYKGIAFAK